MNGTATTESFNLPQYFLPLPISTCPPPLPSASPAKIPRMSLLKNIKSDVHAVHHIVWYHDVYWCITLLWCTNQWSRDERPEARGGRGPWWHGQTNTPHPSEANGTGENYSIYYHLSTKCQVKTEPKIAIATQIMPKKTSIQSIKRIRCTAMCQNVWY